LSVTKGEGAREGLWMRSWWGGEELEACRYLGKGEGEKHGQDNVRHINEVPATVRGTRGREREQGRHRADTDWEAINLRMLRGRRGDGLAQNTRSQERCNLT